MKEQLIIANMKELLQLIKSQYELSRSIVCNTTDSNKNIDNYTFENDIKPFVERYDQKVEDFVHFLRENQQNIPTIHDGQIQMMIDHYNSISVECFDGHKSKMQFMNKYNFIKSIVNKVEYELLQE
ncbi:DUF1798 family protein [Abyssicoccus albus]|uniref:Uncharacterized protein DUF1798 n=1 Tax=Abyssicoccus albus TaxID=1817405 RepID=A0A3N5BJI2_9BACL|nr:DUF1798 family protein [Abyssicoccus albus]RPF58004.1 uncharacterized protein DUF1798 [Abyssicoccus albus]